MVIVKIYNRIPLFSLNFRIGYENPALSRCQPIESRKLDVVKSNTGFAATMYGHFINLKHRKSRDT
jgi:hypothetical protein